MSDFGCWGLGLSSGGLGFGVWGFWSLCQSLFLLHGTHAATPNPKPFIKQMPKIVRRVPRWHAWYSNHHSSRSDHSIDLQRWEQPPPGTNKLIRWTAASFWGLSPVKVNARSREPSIWSNREGWWQGTTSKTACPCTHPAASPLARLGPALGTGRGGGADKRVQLPAPMERDPGSSCPGSWLVPPAGPDETSGHSPDATQQGRAQEPHRAWVYPSEEIQGLGLRVEG